MAYGKLCYGDRVEPQSHTIYSIRKKWTKISKHDKITHSIEMRSSVFITLF
jgi:hypothetical protein